MSKLKMAILTAIAVALSTCMSVEALAQRGFAHGGGGFRMGGFQAGGFRSGGFRPAAFQAGGFRTGGFHAGGFRPRAFQAAPRVAVGAWRGAYGGRGWGGGWGPGGLALGALAGAAVASSYYPYAHGYDYGYGYGEDVCSVYAYGYPAYDCGIDPATYGYGYPSYGYYAAPIVVRRVYWAPRRAWRPRAYRTYRTYGTAYRTSGRPRLAGPMVRAGFAHARGIVRVGYIGGVRRR